MSLTLYHADAYEDDVAMDGDFAAVWATALDEAKQEAADYDRALAYRWLDDVTDAMVDPDGFAGDDDNIEPDEWKWHADGYRSGDEDDDDFDEDPNDGVGYVVDDWDGIEPDRPLFFVVGPAAGTRPRDARLVTLVDPGDPGRGTVRRWAIWTSQGNAAAPTGAPTVVLDDQVADAVIKRLRAGSDVRLHNAARRNKRAVAGRTARFLLDAAPRPWQTYALGLADTLSDAATSGLGSVRDTAPGINALRAPLDDPDARLVAAARVVLARDALYDSPRDIDRDARAAEKVGIVKGWLAAVRNMDPDIDAVLARP
ncbi:hypothetical protein pqer_cds_930 [Pandoravirus quercus]|uniref:Uncharacterized protein n=2 Tax=Pandoravirus TaxID=2060084 RepID=A0A2U7UAC9_9VIRU|nr:hypothetical protein pqer_cds_930 [Pandoravirus quercus]AVK75352.1 hypothetical protein pqer_cds_930 [Pandoravirus quercus]QBZ81530.1 hypothetical protein pclt_cds_944 [Pandoravirus celtis]